MKEKRCADCGETKPLTEFHLRKTSRDGRQTYCKPCAIARVREWQRETGWKPKPRKIGESYKRHHVSEERFREMAEKNDGLCDSCKVNRATHVDHDHSCCPGFYSCGKCVRGLLCAQCNMALGLLRDEEARIKALLEYLNSVR